MPPLVIALVLSSAVLHATWNALLRAGADRLQFIMLMGGLCAAAALPVAIFVPHPAVASWPFLAVSALVQVGYSLLLVRAYREGQLAHVYPIARGSAPLLVTLAAAVVAGDRLAPLSFLGVLLVSGGIVAIAFGRGRPHLPSSLFALGCGGSIATYMVLDGLGVRASGHPIGYAAWQEVAHGALMPLAFFALRGRWPTMRVDAEFAKVCVGAVISVLAYGVVLWAMSLTAMGQVSALRETSILFAALIGAAFLKEPLTPRRLAGAAMIAGGAVALSVG